MSPRWRSLAAVLVGLIGFAALGAFVVVHAVRDTVLDARSYQDALAGNDVYNRVYSELLADPELRDTTNRLLAGIPVVDASLATAALRRVLPPETLRDGFELLSTEIVAYLRGDRRRLDPEVDLTELVARVGPEALARFEDELARLPVRAIAGSLDDLATEVELWAQVVARGEIPDDLPVPAELIPDRPEAIAARVASLLGDRPPPAVIDQIVAAIGAGDYREAILLAVPSYARPHVQAHVADLEASLEGGRMFPVVDRFAERARQPTRRVVAELESWRSVARHFSTTTMVLTLVIVVAAAVLLYLLLGWTGIAASLVVWSLGLLATLAALAATVAGPLDEAVARAGSSWDLPPALRTMIDDVRGSLGRELFASARRPLYVVLACGAVVTVVLAVRATIRGPIPVRRVVAGAAVVAVALPIVLVVVDSAPDVAETIACNGHPELCDRRYDEVVFAATHNSMSAADLGWIWPEHERGLRAQLDFGIRVLLIDVHTWSTAAEVAEFRVGLAPEAAAALDRILAPVDEPRPGLFLCHSLCQLGATPFPDALAEIHDFLLRNPFEIVTLVVQDEAPGKEIAAAIRESGLDRYAFAHGGSRWPTLGEMIERDERLVVFAESDTAPPRWYHMAFEHMRETPFHVEAPDALDCSQNRGREEASLFLMNHWITRAAPSRADATILNDADFIVARARRCARERGSLPNFVAVNFYGIGDVLGAVDRLNRLR